MIRKKRQHRSIPYRLSQLPKKVKQRLSVMLLWLVCTSIFLFLTSNLVQAQRSPSDRTIQNLEEQEIRRYSQPTPIPNNSEAPSDNLTTPAIKTTPNPRPNQSNTNPDRIKPAPLPNIKTEETQQTTVTPPPRIIPLPTQENQTPETQQTTVTPPPRIIPLPTQENQTPEIQPRTTTETSPEPVEIIVEEKSTPSVYNLEFNRSPVVGNRFHLRGLYNEARLGFTRPRSWKINNVKALIRFQHSPALLANRSNLTVRVNGATIGSVPLNLKQSRIGESEFDIPVNRLGDFNDISIIAQQTNTNNCEDVNPQDPTLWTEILPDSRLIFNYENTKPD
jgi:hypothetical protein